MSLFFAVTLVFVTLNQAHAYSNAVLTPPPRILQQDLLLPTIDEDQVPSNFDLKEYVRSRIPSIDATLEEAVKSPGLRTDLICEAMRYTLMAGGKRLRPVLCLAACEMFGGSMDMALPAAAAVEMINTATCMYDDLPCMDDDDMRRGMPTNHLVYGEDMTVLAGLALTSTSLQLVSQNTPREKVETNRILDVVTRLGQCIGHTGLVGGQVMDLKSEGKTAKEMTLEDLEFIHRGKAGALLEASVTSGAILGGATPDEVKACEKFAGNIGLAFQIADDILDVTQSSQDLGKTAGKDLAAEKLTYPKLLGLNGARAEAERLIREAKEALSPFGERAIPLMALADFVIQRKS